jgi:hypothetical protein
LINFRLLALTKVHTGKAPRYADESLPTFYPHPPAHFKPLDWVCLSANDRRHAALSHSIAEDSDEILGGKKCTSEWYRMAGIAMEPIALNPVRKFMSARYGYALR